MQGFEELMSLIQVWGRLFKQWPVDVIAKAGAAGSLIQPRCKVVVYSGGCFNQSVGGDLRWSPVHLPPLSKEKELVDLRY